MRLLAADPGQVHLGLCFADFDEATFELHVDACACIDLASYGSGHVVDKFIAFMKAEAIHMDSCDVFIMERQPMFSGGESVSCLLYSHFRDKTVLVHPLSLHKFAGLQGTTYEERKAMVVERAEPIIGHLKGWQEAVRTHDVADALLLLQFYVARNFKKPVAIKMRKKLSEYAFIQKERTVPRKSRFFEEAMSRLTMQ